MEAGFDLFRLSYPEWFVFPARQSSLSFYLAGEEKMPAFKKHKPELSVEVKAHTLSAADRDGLHTWAYRNVDAYSELFDRYFNAFPASVTSAPKYKPLPAFSAWGETAGLSLAEQRISYGPPQVVRRFSTCSVLGIELRGGDSRVRRSNSGCCHASGVFGEILYFFEGRAYSDIASDLHAFARVDWFETLERKRDSNNSLVCVKKAGLSAATKAFNRTHRVVAVVDLAPKNIAYVDLEDGTFAVISNAHQLAV